MAREGAGRWKQQLGSRVVRGGFACMGKGVSRESAQHRGAPKGPSALHTVGTGRARIVLGSRWELVGVYDGFMGLVGTRKCSPESCARYCVQQRLNSTTGCLERDSAC